MNRFLSISSFIVSITALLCVVFKVDVPISNDTFVGLGIAVIGVLATFMVAYQIFTRLDQKERLKEIEESFKKVDRLQTAIIESTGYEQYARRMDSAKLEMDKNPLQALHYGLEALTAILNLDGNYSRISLTMDFIKQIESPIVEQLQKESCDLRNVESCLWHIEQYHNQSFCDLSTNKETLDNIKRELKNIYSISR